MTFRLSDPPRGVNQDHRPPSPYPYRPTDRSLRLRQLQDAHVMLRSMWGLRHSRYRALASEARQRARDAIRDIRRLRGELDR